MAPALLKQETVESSSTPLAEPQLASLARFARAALRWRYSLPFDSEPDDAFPQLAFDKVNITLRTAGRLRASMSGRGLDLKTAIVVAIGKCARDKRFGPPLTAEEIDGCFVELWIQTASQPVNAHALARDVILGVHGLEIRLKGSYAYYKPSVPITSGLRTHADVLEKLSRKAGLPADAWRDPAAEIQRTHWLHIVLPAGEGSGFAVLRRLRRPEPPPLDAPCIESATRATANRLLAVQSEDERYLQGYDAIKDLPDAAAFSSVRQAGCAYSLAWLGDSLGESLGGEFSWSAARAVRALLRHARQFPGDEHAIYIAETSGSQGKLGTSALSLLALQFEPLASLFAEHRRGLRRALLALQNPAGCFEPSISRGASKEGNQDYYPGEALVALGRDLVQEDTAPVRHAFLRAFPYYRDYFRRRPNTAFILWQVDAWRLFDECSTSPRHPSPYSDFVFEMVDWLLPLQYTPDNAPCPEYIGGFPRPGTPRYSSGCYTEAILRACGLALRHGLLDRAERYRTAARQGLSFILRLQIGPESAFLFPRPETAVGGLSANLSSFAMRSDFDQHAITAFLAALEVSRDFPAHAILDP